MPVLKPEKVLTSISGWLTSSVKRHRRMFLSHEALAAHSPSGETSTEKTADAWARELAGKLAGGGVPHAQAAVAVATQDEVAVGG